jgi:hypothetical protein
VIIVILCLLAYVPEGSVVKSTVGWILSVDGLQGPPWGGTGSRGWKEENAKVTGLGRPEYVTRNRVTDIGRIKPVIIIRITKSGYPKFVTFYNVTS